MMGVKKMDGVGEQMSIITDNLQWSPETAYLYKRPNYPHVSGGLLGQQTDARTLIEGMPVARGLIERVNWALARVGDMRQAWQKEMRR